jgi:acyl carrier protein
MDTVPPGQGKKILDLLEGALGCPEEMLIPTSTLRDDLHLTDLDMESMRLLLNRDFKIDIQPADLALLRTVEDVLEAVRERVLPA